MALRKITEEDRERGGRKPLPKTMRAWMAELEGVSDLLKKRPQLKDTQGKVWWESTRTYYEARLLLLAETPPALLPKDAARSIVGNILKSL